MMLAKRLGFSYRVLTPSATRGETGHPFRLRLRDGPGSRLRFGETTALSRSQAQSIRWIDCWPPVNHRTSEARIGNPLRFASPQASARNKSKTSNTSPIPNPSLGIIGRGALFSLH